MHFICFFKYIAFIEYELKCLLCGEIHILTMICLKEQYSVSGS